MDQKRMNHLAVIILVISQCILAGVWYSHSLCRLLWSQVSDFAAASFQMRWSAGNIFLVFFSSLILCYLVAWIISVIHASTVKRGLQVSFLLWCGFFLFFTVFNFSLLQMSGILFAIHAGHSLTSFLLAGGVLAGWRAS